MPGTPSPRRWLFLGVLIDVLTASGAPVTMAPAVLPKGASPLAHLDATPRRQPLHPRRPHGAPLRRRCVAGRFWELGAVPGRRPAHLPDTGRVGPGSDGPHRRQFPGRSARGRPPGHWHRGAGATHGPTIGELDRAFATYGITNVGPPMEQAEAERLLGQLAGAAIPADSNSSEAFTADTSQTGGSLTGPVSSRERQQPATRTTSTPYQHRSMGANRLQERSARLSGTTSHRSGGHHGGQGPACDGR